MVLESTYPGNVKEACHRAEGVMGLMEEVEVKES